LFSPDLVSVHSTFENVIMNESKIQYFHNTYIHCLSYYVIPTYVVYTFYNVHGTYTITKQLFRIRRVSGCFCLIVCLIQAAGLGSLLIIQELRLPENAARLRFVMFPVYVHSTMYTAQCVHVVHSVCTQYNVHCTVWTCCSRCMYTVQCTLHSVYIDQNLGHVLC